MVRLALRMPISALLAFALTLAGCSGDAHVSDSEHSANDNSAAGHGMRAIRSPPASGFSSIDWSVFGRKLFSCLPPSGQSWDQFLPYIRFVDVTGDGVPDALVTGACPSPTSPNPTMVLVLTDRSSPEPKVIGVLPEGAGNYFDGLSVSLSGTEITMRGPAYSRNAPSCCPDLNLVLNYRWRNNHFVQVGRTVRRMSLHDQP